MCRLSPWCEIELTGSLHPYGRASIRVEASELPVGSAELVKLFGSSRVELEVKVDV
ncbi:hypothetical protein MLGJGCBP_03548 [Rhodococcus sp. T7]|nr:hypothetical protein MLGJGCBP_09518 [Rhodococcus sp. T7]KAF0963242.1 hypothetical protein MLGJGCBP_03548 [Rhodococcus sp. T7]